MKTPGSLFQGAGKTGVNTIHRVQENIVTSFDGDQLRLTGATWIDVLLENAAAVVRLRNSFYDITVVDSRIDIGNGTVEVGSVSVLDAVFITRN